MTDSQPIEIEDDDVRQTVLSNEEYKIWKKNSPFLYDHLITHALEWPSLTCQWFPDREEPAGKNYIQHRLLIGTHTSGHEQNHLQIARVLFPTGEGEIDRHKYDQASGEIGSYGSSTARFEIIQKINHDGEVNRARYCPQNPDLIATRTVLGPTYIFDRTKHPSEPTVDKCKPDIVCQGQEKEGYGLSWSPIKYGHLLAASEDNTVCHWDINSYKKGNNAIQPLKTYTGHSAIVEDVQWHNYHEQLFGSVGDDRLLLIWDTRENGDRPKQRVEAHAGEVNALAFSPNNEYVVCTGSTDKTIGMWDLRNLKAKLHSLESHTDEVLQLAWSPINPTILASASADRRVNLWDLSKIGEEQQPDDAEDGPPELAFMHGGHTARPCDIAFNPHGDVDMLASVAEDNILHLWQPSKNVMGGNEDEEIPAEELE